MMKNWMFVSCVATVACAGLMVGQEPKGIEPAKEHALIKNFLGQWEVESAASMGPGTPEMKCKGTSSARMLGNLWVIIDIKSEMPGMAVQAVQTIGYDSEKKKFVGSWVDTMTTYMWKYDGTYDEATKTLTFEAEGPNFTTPGKTCKFRDAYEFKADGHIIAKSYMMNDEGKWTQFMTGNMKRKSQ